MSSTAFVEEDYERIATDPEYRARLLADPVGVVCKLFGYTPKPGFAIEVIEQVEDTIVIVIPPRPQTDANLEQALSQVADRVLDLLFSSGIGGFLIPDEAQKWDVREMRMASTKAQDGLT